MKRIILLLLVLLGLAGCKGQFYPDEYSFVTEHQAPYAVRETVTEQIAAETEPEKQVTTVSNLYQLRDGIVQLILNGEESGSFLVKNYAGSLETETKGMESRIRKDYPKYTFAFGSLECAIDDSPAGTFVNVSMDLKMSPEELRAIQSRSYEGAVKRICRALNDQESSITILITNFPKDGDLEARLDDYILHHPYEIVEAPSILINVFPKSGDTRAVNLRFLYDTDSGTLSLHKSIADTFLNWTFENHFNSNQSAAEIVETLFRNLVPPGDYSSAEDATVYTQVVGQKKGSSRTMASVVEYFCKRNGIDCGIVIGERDGETWYWNCISDEGQWRMFDLHAAALNGEVPALLYPWEMSGYRWEQERYPELLLEEPPEPITTEPTEPEEHAQEQTPEQTEPEPAATEAVLPSEAEESIAPTTQEETEAQVETETIPAPTEEP